MALLTNVGDGNAVAGVRRGGQDLAVLLNVDDSGTRRPNGCAVIGSLSIGKGDIAKVGEWNLASVLQEVFDNPLGVLFAEWGLSTKAKGVCHGLLRGQVVNSSTAGGGRSGNHGYGDLVTGIDGDAGEIIGEVWVPFIPGREAGLSVLNAHVDTYRSIRQSGSSERSRFGITGLENGRLASIAVNTDPSASAVLG